MRKMLIVLVFALLGATLAVASGQQATEADVVEISYISTPSTPADFEREEYTISTFQELNPGIKVTTIPTAVDANALLQLLAAGAAPDILEHIDISKVAEYVEAGYLIPLDGYTEQFGWRERFSEASMKQYTIGGKQYLLPGQSIMMMVYYNKDLFKEHGWDIPTTYLELAAISDDMLANDIIPFSYGNATFKQSYDRWVTMIFNGYLGNDGMKKVINGDYAMDGPEVRGALEFLVGFMKKYVYEDAPSISEDEATTLMFQGKAAMFASGQWQLNNFLRLDLPFELGLFALPGLRAGQEAIVAGGYGAGDGIYGGSEHPDAVAKFLDFRNSEAEAEWWLTERGIIWPLIKPYSKDAMSQVSSAFKEEIQVYNKAVNENRIGYATWAYWPSKTQSYAWGNMEALWLGQLTMDEYVQGLARSYKDDVANGRLRKVN